MKAADPAWRPLLVFMSFSLSGSASVAELWKDPVIGLAAEVPGPAARPRPG